MDERHPREARAILLQAAIGSDQGRVGEFVLHQQVDVAPGDPRFQLPPGVAGEAGEVGPRCKRHNLDFEAALAEMTYDDAVVEVAARKLVERAIDHPAQAHYRDCRYEAQAVGLSHNRTSCPINR